MAAAEMAAAGMAAAGVTAAPGVRPPPCYILEAMISHFVHHVRSWPQLSKLVSKERRSTVQLPWQARFASWGRGFLSESAALYALERNDPRDFVSDYYRLVVSPKINGGYAVILSDKLLFAKVFGGFGERLPQTFALLDQGRLIDTAQGDGPRLGCLTDLLSLCRERGALIFKPLRGGGGWNIHLLRAQGAGLSLNGRAVSDEEALRFLRTREQYLVGEVIHQHAYAARIYAPSVNTIRMLTMRDASEQRAFLAVAAHRFGSVSSKHVDNWSQGGLSALVDLESGTLGQGAAFKRGKLSWHRHHPDTDATIEGVQVPNWTAVKAAILEMADSAPFLPYIGWDVAVTETGVKVLEGNNFSGMNLLQVHGPLLKDARVRRFYARFRA